MRKQTVFAALFALLGVVSCSDSGMPGQGGAPSSSGGSSGGVGSSSSSSGSGGSGTVSAADLPRDCFWAARSDPNAANTLYPDSYATYWVASINIPAGGQVILKGRYPHARYLSFNLYNPRLEPLDALADVEIAPNASSAQPYAVNARRDATPRDYTVSIVAGVRPDDAALRAPNTLYSFQAVGAQRQPSNQAVILYRIYVEDQGRDITGGAGLPQVVLKYANGQEVTGSEACSAMERLPTSTAGDSLNTVNPAVETQPGTAAFKHLQWLKFFDLQSAQANRFNATPAGQGFRTALGGNTNNAGGFASNVHNNYIYATASQMLGEVAAFKARMPATPRTRDGRTRMEDGLLRYLSFCTNEANSQRFIQCVYDEQITRDANNTGILVVARAADRPANARPECGVTWLEWGPATNSLIIYRHMLPVAKEQFPEAIQYIPGPAGENEEKNMAAYFPYGTHFGKTAFEALGCPVSADAIPNKAASN